MSKIVRYDGHAERPEPPPTPHEPVGLPPLPNGATIYFILVVAPNIVRQ
jgi:hypothetical protein